MIHQWETTHTEQEIMGNAGFVYRITNLSNGRQYIGRKYTTTHRKTLDPKTGKYRKMIKESDWRVYTGSCKELNDDIDRLGHSRFKFEILSLHRTKGETNYEEVRLQMTYNVLYARRPDNHNEYLFYNSNINGKWYRKRS